MLNVHFNSHINEKKMQALLDVGGKMNEIRHKRDEVDPKNNNFEKSRRLSNMHMKVRNAPEKQRCPTSNNPSKKPLSTVKCDNSRATSNKNSDPAKAIANFESTFAVKKKKKDKEGRGEKSNGMRKRLNWQECHYLSDLNEMVFEESGKISGWMEVRKNDRKANNWKRWIDDIYNHYFDWCYHIQTEQLQMKCGEANVPQLKSETTNQVLFQLLQIIERVQQSHSSLLFNIQSPRGVQLPVHKWRVDKQVLLMIGWLVSIDDVFHCEFTRDQFIAVLKYLALIQNGFTQKQCCNVDLGCALICLPAVPVHGSFIQYLREMIVANKEDRLLSRQGDKRQTLVNFEQEEEEEEEEEMSSKDGSRHDSYDQSSNAKGTYLTEALSQLTNKLTKQIKKKKRIDKKKRCKRLDCFYFPHGSHSHVQIYIYIYTYIRKERKEGKTLRLHPQQLQQVQQEKEREKRKHRNERKKERQYNETSKAIIKSNSKKKAGINICSNNNNNTINNNNIDNNNNNNDNDIMKEYLEQLENKSKFEEMVPLDSPQYPDSNTLVVLRMLFDFLVTKYGDVLHGIVPQSVVIEIM
ncbi:hypothetical protein RFI_29330, partial [Reticulomyxa filosa]